MLEITSQVREFLAEHGISKGRATIFCPHTTAAITINENADPDVQDDMLFTLGKLLPQNAAGYKHVEGNSDAHLKASVIGASETIIIEDFKLILGTWQGVYFCEFDGPRQRKFVVALEGI